MGSLLTKLAYCTLPEPALVARLAAQLPAHAKLAEIRAVAREGAQRGEIGRLEQLVRDEYRRQARIRHERALRKFVQPEGSAIERLRRVSETTTRIAVQAAYRRCGYRRAQGKWAGGQHTLTVEIGPVPGVRCSTEKVWSSNGKWSGLNSSHWLTVPVFWRKIRAYYPHGTVIVRGRECLILAETEKGLLVVVQGIGTSIRTEIVPCSPAKT